MIQFYVADIADSLQLPESESGHCIRVLRMQRGDEIVCVDGHSHRYLCRITEAHPKHCGIEILKTETIPPHWQHHITLCFAPTKNLDRIEWMAEKCTELGTDRFIPVLCSNSERKVLKTERLHKILISAMKQSLKTTLPILQELTPLKQVLTSLTDEDGTPFEGDKYICYCSDQVERRDLVNLYTGNSDVAILIGPEGDFSPEEVQLALQHGWQPVTLGESRLRTETAAVTAVADIHCLLRQQKKI